MTDSTQLNQLEEEIDESYQAAIEANSGIVPEVYSAEAMDDWRKAWTKRPEDLDILVSSADSDIRIYVARIGRPSDLDKLVNDEDAPVRRVVAKHGRDKDLDKLVHDPDKDVRTEVARQGRDKDLDILVDDKDAQVRRTVAGQGRDQDLDKLVDDKDAAVRYTVANQGRDKDLDRLVNDPDKDVRLAVLKQGRDKDLDQLVSDDDCYVRRIAARQLPNSMSASEAQEALAKAGLSISQAVQAAMTKVDQAKLAYDIAAPNGDPNAPQLKQRLDAAKQDLAQETISAIETLNDKTLGKPLGDDELPF